MTARALGRLVDPWGWELSRGPQGQDLAGTAPVRGRVARDTRAAPTPGIRDLSEDGAGMRLGQGKGPPKGPAQWGPWLGRAGL